VSASGEGSQPQFTITTIGPKGPFQHIRQTLDGRAVGAHVADLNR
jgi:hypothetical protein